MRAVFSWVDAEYDKLAVERVIASDPRLPATILRLPMVYGPGDPLHRLYSVVKRIDDGRTAIPLEESYARFRPCRGYVENVAHAIALAAVSEQAAGRVYNVAEPVSYTEAEWAGMIAAAAGRRVRVVAVPRERAPRHLLAPFNLVQHLTLDSSRIRSELGYTEPVPVEEALRRTVAWERANPPRVDPAMYDYAAEDACSA